MNRIISNEIRKVLEVHYKKENIKVRVWKANMGWRDITINIYNTPDGTKVVESFIRPLIQEYQGEKYSLDVYTTQGQKPKLPTPGHHIQGSRLLW
jgi:hypothetical protein